MRTKKTSGLVALCAVPLAIAACGGSGPTAPSTPAQPAVTAAHPANSANASNLDIGKASSQRSEHAKQESPRTAQRQATAGQHSEAARQPRITRHAGVQKARPTPALSSDDNAPSVIHKLDPCTLVSLQRARAITGGAVTTSVEAPLGPTCVYHVAHQRSDITLDIEVSNIARVARSMTKRHTLTIQGHRAYCGQLGSQMLYVVLPGKKLLHVLAPCAVAQQFAVTALGRLTA